MCPIEKGEANRSPRLASAVACREIPQRRTPARVGASSGRRSGPGSRFEEALPIVDEQTENCDGEEDSANHYPAEVLGEVKRRGVRFRQMKGSLHLLHIGIHHRSVVWGKHGYDRTRKPEEL